MDLISQLIERAKVTPQRIVLPEGTEERTLTAADQALADGLAKIILLGDSKEITLLANQLGLKNIDKATIIDPANHPKKQQYAKLLAELRKKKGMTIEQALELVTNPLYLGCLIIKSGDADGQLAGAQNTTGNVLRPALQIIKTAPGISCVSGAMIMITNKKEYGKDGAFIFADIAVTPVPDAKQLSEIAVSSARTAENVMGVKDPKVALLSFSTKGSAKHENIDKVSEAVKLAQKLAPNYKIDGELQADAALVSTVATSKAPNSEVAGQANVLVFPNLEAGNIGYKLVERLGNARAIGPVLQGIAAPVNDLSRGCNSDDIYKMIAVTANQAIATNKLNK